MYPLVPSWLQRREYGAAAVLTVLLWLFALVLWSAQDLASGAPFPRPYRVLLVETFVIGIACSVALAGVIGVTRRMRRAAGIAIVAVVTLGLATLHGWIDAHLLAQLRLALGAKPMPLSELFNRGLMPFVLIYGLYATALGLMFSAMAVRDSERRLAEARSAAQQAQLAALRFQLNPHFLFNTLNAISSLIVTSRNAEAERMTMKLSEFLRASLEADPEIEVTLDEELATTQSYLDIEAVRFGDRLRVVFECPTSLLNVYVPSFLLQPLVENSIKYAVAPSRRTVTLTVRADDAQGALRLVVEDDGGRAFGTLPVGGIGLGLANVRQRLAAFYGSAAWSNATATDRGFAVTLSLPLRRAVDLQAAE
ncbi:sensor histidine kinase [Sphingomonas sp.]|uniref:sensor histidine kinase n=1 Tax=Sphingomonas sp. TaxID=28214 RepID=UPI002C4E2418|nr:histidine kinase [Sphingomonas sp.]HWK36690.1 histidine kinase [Sphingomonas sp.]